MRALRGKPVIVAFLYSTCEDTCPIQAQQIKGALNELGTDYPALAVSVDPANDSPRNAKAFNSKQRMTGRLTWVLGQRAAAGAGLEGLRAPPASATTSSTTPASCWWTPRASSAWATRWTRSRPSGWRTTCSFWRSGPLT